MLKKLQEGDLVEVIASSSYIENKKNFSAGLKILNDWGLNIKSNNVTSRKYNYLAGDDNTRFSEIERAQNSKLIVFAKGGWGAARLLEKNPKWKQCWMLGFSDACSLLLSRYSKGYLGSIHGPMITTLINEPIWSLQRIKNLLFEGYVKDIKGIPLREGIAHGEVVVSNLTIISFLVGTPHFPDLKGKIVIFEDINEEIYKLDRMFTYLRMSEKLNGIVGIGFGNFLNKSASIQERQLFKNLIIERFTKFEVPMIFDLPIGHITGNACVPIGFKATINGYTGNLSVSVTVD